MNTIEFVRSPEGFVISRENDKRLFAIGQVLINDSLRSQVKEILQRTLDINMEKPENIESTVYKVHLAPITGDNVEITLIDKQNPEEPLETHINIPDLLDLIDAFEDALEADSDVIIITREQDTFELNVA